MKSLGFGVWTMLAFWASAVGSIVLGIHWAKRRRVNPVQRSLLEKSLRQRLQAGEITPELFDRKMRTLEKASGDD